MMSTVSVAKGCFVFKNGLNHTKAVNGKRSKCNTTPSSLLSVANKSQPWYQAYTRMWEHISKRHKDLQMKGYAETMVYLRNFVRSSYKAGSGRNENVQLPTIALLTGINQPDHYAFFKTFADELRQENTSLVTIIQSRDCPNMKSAIEAMVAGLMDSKSPVNDDDDDDTAEEKHLRRSQYTMPVLKAWYASQYGDKQYTLTVVIPDFENFQRDILQQFILLLCHNCETLPIVLVLGVATDLSTLHRTLSFSDTGRMSLQVLQTPPSTHSLNEILEMILLTPNCPITLSGKVFTLLTDIFLYYDFSINSFMQAFKYCVMEHYNQGNAYALCCRDNGTQAAISHMTADDFDTIRRLPSFRKHVESLEDCQMVIAILKDDAFLAMSLPSMIEEVRLYLCNFYCSLRVLLTLVADLPKHRLGKQLRDLYGKCTASPIVDSVEFKESWNLLAFMSKTEILAQLHKVIKTMAAYMVQFGIKQINPSRKTWVKLSNKLTQLMEAIDAAGTTHVVDTTATASDQFSSSTKLESREQLKARLLKMVANQHKQTNEFTKNVAVALDFIRDEIIGKYLVPFSMGPALLELFVFSDLSAIRTHIMGAPRAALHTALNNPQSYMQCSCCTLTNATQMAPTLPDLSIVYKLHLESGHMINMFDWLQAFKSIVTDDTDDSETDHIDPQMQARFTRAVAELQFLGFIKISKRKTDHVTRLTW